MIVLSIVTRSVLFFSFLFFPFLSFSFSFSLLFFLFLFLLSYPTLLFQTTTIFNISLRFPSHLSSPPIIFPPSSPSKIFIFHSFFILSSIIFQFHHHIPFHSVSRLSSYFSYCANPSYNKSHHTSHNTHCTTVPRCYTPY